MNAPSEDIKDMLAAVSSLALTFATDLFVSEMPDTPDQCVCVYDTGGFDPEGDFNYERPTAMIRVRGAKGAYTAGHELAQACRDALLGTADSTVNGARYIGIWVVGDVNHIGYDDNHRPLFTVNFRIHRAAA
jgi:hypothetical protein